MANWLHGKDGQATLIHDGDYFRDSNGYASRGSKAQTYTHHMEP